MTKFINLHKIQDNKVLQVSGFHLFISKNQICAQIVSAIVEGLVFAVARRRYPVYAKINYKLKNEERVRNIQQHQYPCD
jgi:hypothetical protein